ncbi:hypothetical protein HELRODRAFT_133620, partial [Helobdella robusta]|uniref:Protein kinase domain-containing protein n=1 Tax=Helobdella robusta TaxID=6412 RepID=T1EI17_HELRO
EYNKFIEEAMTMHEFNHPNVLSLIGIVIKRSANSGNLRWNGCMPLVILPFMKHGDLLTFIRTENNTPTVRHLMDFGIQIAGGMSYLSNLKFVHRDLAARNCMLADDLSVKVADFGLSRDVYEREYYSSGDRKAKLPIKWMAIESLEKGIYSTKSDVWSFGVVLWELLTRGASPYLEVDSWDFIKFLKSGRRLMQPVYCPLALYRMMRRCWHTDPSSRPTFDELITSIQNII